MARHPRRWGKSVIAVFLFGAILARPGPIAARDAPPRSVPLPSPEKWNGEIADVQDVDGALQVIVPVNYKVGRAVSPGLPAREGDLFTFAAEVTTHFGSTTLQSWYRSWLEIEFLGGTGVIATAASPELLGTQGEERLLGVTATAPAGTTAVRVALCAQNKYWNLIDNRARAVGVRLHKLDGGRGRGLALSAAAEFPNRTGERTARLVVRGDWPDGTAVALAADRGAVPPTALLARGRAEVTLAYDAEDVGAATVMVRVADAEANLRLADPHAASLVLEAAFANGQPSPVLVQLSRDGRMLPGRYQTTVQGIFVTPPWAVDLAPGRWQLRVSRGPRFRAIERAIEVESGEAVTLDRLDLTPIADLPRLGWYGGDADGDVYHGELIYTDVSAETAADVARAMGLDWVGVGRWGVSGHGTPNPRTWGEARALMGRLSGPDFLFLWTDERPKSREGHACFVGLDRPDGDPFAWGWTGAAGRPLRNFESLGLIRASGGATFVNHPLRWWMNGDRFNTNMYSSLPFDLCAAARLDGLNINDRPGNLALWSMLLDHGYRVAATAGADFGLDRPGGPPPGTARMYCYCPDGLSADALAEAVRRQHTIVSTGPLLLAEVDGKPPGTTVSAGQPQRIRARAWARGDQPDALKRVELWAHGKVIATKAVESPAEAAEVVFDWTPAGERDWVAVRAVSRGGWAMTSAFYAGDGWRPREPARCRLTLDVAGLSDRELAGTTVEVWDNPPALITSKQLMRSPLGKERTLDVPVTATVLVVAPGGRRREVSVYEAIGMAEWIEEVATGAEREQPLLDWASYEDVLRRCRQATAEVSF